MRRRLSTLPPAPEQRAQYRTWRQCCAGELPAEQLSTRDREDLIAGLHALGWTDVDIASHTKQTTYTTARIRARLGLTANEGS